MMYAAIKWAFAGLSLVAMFAVPTLASLGFKAAGAWAFAAFLALFFVALYFAERQFPNRKEE